MQGSVLTINLTDQRVRTPHWRLITAGGSRSFAWGQMPVKGGACQGISFPDPQEDPKSRSLNGGSYKVPLVV